MNPLSNCIPSTTSNVVPILLASSTVITPSLPTLSIASANKSPIVESLFADIVPTCAICDLSLTFLHILFNSSTTTFTALSMPLFSAIVFAPAVTYFTPSLKIASARIVAVVVPSPATSLVLDATSQTIFAPIFSNGSPSSTSFATVTPSFVTVGEPKLFSKIRFLPVGPIVTLTASASFLIPFFILRLASSSNKSCFAAIIYLLNLINQF